MARRSRYFGKARVRDPVLAACRRGHPLEGALAGHGHADVAVGGRHGPEDRPRRLWRHLELGGLRLAERDAQHALEHGDVEVLALAGRMALVQRRGDGAEGVGAGHDVGDVDAAVVRTLPAGLVGEVGEIEARGGMDHGRVGGKVG